MVQVLAMAFSGPPRARAGASVRRLPALSGAVTSSATVRLFCFPYAGSGPSIFNAWPAGLRHSVEAFGIVYPGHEARLAERPLRDLGAIAASLVDDILPLLDRPYAFFGHSMGAYVAFELARRLPARGTRPDHVFLSGAGAPHLPPPCVLHDLPGAAFLRELIRLDGFPPEILRSAELVRHVLPVLRADFTACETYAVPPTLVDFPITAFAGRGDARADVARVEAWDRFAGVSFDREVFDGGHFFVRDHRPAMVTSINRRLAVLA